MFSNRGLTQVDNPSPSSPVMPLTSTPSPYCYYKQPHNKRLPRTHRTFFRVYPHPSPLWAEIPLELFGPAPAPGPGVLLFMEGFICEVIDSNHPQYRREVYLTGYNEGNVSWTFACTEDVTPVYYTAYPSQLRPFDDRQSRLCRGEFTVSDDGTVWTKDPSRLPHRPLSIPVNLPPSKQDPTLRYEKLERSSPQTTPQPTLSYSSGQTANAPEPWSLHEGRSSSGQTTQPLQQSDYSHQRRQQSISGGQSTTAEAQSSRGRTTSHALSSNQTAGIPPPPPPPPPPPTTHPPANQDEQFTHFQRTTKRVAIYTKEEVKTNIIAGFYQFVQQMSFFGEDHVAKDALMAGKTPSVEMLIKAVLAQWT